MTRAHIPVTPGSVFHLPDRHNQKSHGNRKGKSDNIKSDRSSSTDKNSGSSTKRTRSFEERAQDAKTGDAALQSAPIHNRKTLDAATMEERPAYPGARYNIETDVPLNGVPGEDVRSAISDYSSNGYENINWALRQSNGDVDAIPESHPTSRGTYSAKRARDGVRGIDAAMKASPLENDVLVYRGVSNPTLTFGDAWSSDGDNTGLTFIDNAFVSTTANRSMASNFAGYGAGVRMNILVPKGTNAIGIEQGAGSGLTQEKELLLDRGNRYRVTRDYEVDGIRTLDVEVV